MLLFIVTVIVFSVVLLLTRPQFHDNFKLTVIASAFSLAFTSMYFTQNAIHKKRILSHKIILFVASSLVLIIVCVVNYFLGVKSIYFIQAKNNHISFVVYLIVLSSIIYLVNEYLIAKLLKIQNITISSLIKGESR